MPQWHVGGAECRVQQSIEHIRGFAQSTSNDLRMEHAVLIRNVRIDGHRLIVIAKIARIQGAQEGTGLESEALPIGRGHGAIAPARVCQEAFAWASA